MKTCASVELPLATPVGSPYFRINVVVANTRPVCAVFDVIQLAAE